MLGAAIKKDIQLVLRDRGALGSLFLLPVIFISVFGSLFGDDGNGTTEPRTVLVFHEPGDAMAARMVAAIDGSGMFRTRREHSPDSVRAHVARDRLGVGLVIPRDFDPRAGRPAELVIDGGAPMAFRGPIEGALSGILTMAHSGEPPGARVLEARTPPGIRRPLDHASGFQVSVPGNVVLFGFFLALIVALSFVEERRTGTWRRILAAPVSRPVILVAKLVPYTIIGLVQFGFLFGVGMIGFGMKIAGSALALGALTLAVILCATALGLFIASFGGSERQIGGIGSITLLVMGLVGGAMVPRLAMPETMQQIGLCVPHGWALDGYYDILVREGTTLADVWREIAAVLGFAAGFAVIGAARFRFER